MIAENKLKKEIVHFSHKLDQKGFVANHDGNISIKQGKRIWATPTAQNKGDITEEMLVILDDQGKKISGTHSVFSEIDLHLACYRLRPDITAVVHAHPAVATSFAVTGTPLQKVFIAEAVVTLGDEIPLVPFIPPGCPDTQKTLSNYLPYFDVVLLQNHGVLAVGTTLAQAYYRLELVEHLAKIEWHSKPFGSPKVLPEKTVAKLLEKRQKAGLGHPKPVILTSSESGGKDSLVQNKAISNLDQIIAEEVSRFLDHDSQKR